jgi:hypothetical protein
MTTQVIVLGDEPVLVAELLTFERADLHWRSWINTVEREGAPDHIAWEHAMTTLRAGSRVYGYFVSHRIL